eukprot:jgi/Mesen1/4243/ME000022S03539
MGCGVSPPADWSVGARRECWGGGGGVRRGAQIIELTWALRMAALLNRTLIVPPKLGHYSVIPSVGKCQTNPTPPDQIRRGAWLHYPELLCTSDYGYVSMGDILDLGRIPSSVVRTIDLRHLLAKQCGCPLGPSCRGAWCRQLDSPPPPDTTQVGPPLPLPLFLSLPLSPFNIPSTPLHMSVDSVPGSFFSWVPCASCWGEGFSQHSRYLGAGSWMC